MERVTNLNPRQLQSEAYYTVRDLVHGKEVSGLFFFLLPKKVVERSFASLEEKAWERETRENRFQKRGSTDPLPRKSLFKNGRSGAEPFLSQKAHNRTTMQKKRLLLLFVPPSTISIVRCQKMALSSILKQKKKARY
jgi:hypothetical protein